MSPKEINFMMITPLPNDLDKIRNYIQESGGQIERIYHLHDGIPVFNRKEGGIKIKEGIVIFYYGNPDSSSKLASKIKESSKNTGVNFGKGKILYPD